VRKTLLTPHRLQAEIRFLDKLDYPSSRDGLSGGGQLPHLTYASYNKKMTGEKGPTYSKLPNEIAQSCGRARHNEDAPAAKRTLSQKGITNHIPNAMLEYAEYQSD
jgi:hypothetical protein